MNTITHTITTHTRDTRLISCVVVGLILTFLSGAVPLGSVTAFAQAEPTVTFMLEKKLSDAYPVGYTADQFSFTVSGYTTPVTLTAFNPDSANGTINLPVGTYTLSEVGPIGFVPGEWTVQWSGAGCANQSGPVTTITVTTSDIGLGNFGCRADNQWRPGTLRVIKQIVGTTTPYENFDFTVTQGVTERFSGPFDADGDNDVTIAAGAYTLTEASYPGYVPSYSADCTGIIAQGGSKTCTITNTYTATTSSSTFPGTIIIEKQTLPDGNQTSFTFNPSWSEADIVLQDGGRSTSTPLVPGMYSIVEIVPATWVQSSVVCSDGSSLAALVLASGETINCVVTNTQNETSGGGDSDLQYRLVFGYVWHDQNSNTVWDVEQTNPTDDESDLAGWVITITDGSTTLSTVTDEMGYYSFMVPQGTWTISEELQPEWGLTFPAVNQHVVNINNVETVLLNPKTQARYFFARLFEYVLPTAYAQTSNNYGPYNFGNVQFGTGGDGGSSSVGGSRRSNQHNVPMTSPQPLVLGEAVSVLPVGAPNTGAGGTATPQVPKPILIIFGSGGEGKTRLLMRKR